MKVIFFNPNATVADAYAIVLRHLVGEVRWYTRLWAVLEDEWLLEAAFVCEYLTQDAMSLEQLFEEIRRRRGGDFPFVIFTAWLDHPDCEEKVRSLAGYDSGKLLQQTQYTIQNSERIVALLQAQMNAMDTRGRFPSKKSDS